jgi:hypothetical protein
MIFFTIKMFGRSLWPPTLYTSPTRPPLATMSMALQWSSTYSQSRTFMPSPYTGRPFLVLALLIISGISFSGNWYGP